MKRKGGFSKGGGSWGEKGEGLEGRKRLFREELPRGKEKKPLHVCRRGKKTGASKNSLGFGHGSRTKRTNSVRGRRAFPQFQQKGREGRKESTSTSDNSPSRVELSTSIYDKERGRGGELLFHLRFKKRGDRRLLDHCAV